jgi:hypothetical protein
MMMDPMTLGQFLTFGFFCVCFGFVLGRNSFASQRDGK